MEKLFHARWWDYSQKPFNLNGRVCAGTLIPFGLMGLTLVYWVKPFFFSVFGAMHAQVRSALCAVLCCMLLVELVQPLCFSLFARIPDTARLALCAALCTLFVTDAIVSVTVLGKIRKTANLSEADDTENITRCVREKLAEQGMLMRRTLRAFPYARLYSNALVARMKAQQRKLREEARAKKNELRDELNRRERMLREEIRKLRH